MLQIQYFNYNFTTKLRRQAVSNSHLDLSILYCENIVIGHILFFGQTTKYVIV